MNLGIIFGGREILGILLPFYVVLALVGFRNLVSGNARRLTRMRPDLVRGHLGPGFVFITWPGYQSLEIFGSRL